jgi:hypothetical protein
VLGALFGRKVTSSGNVGRAGTAMRGMGRAMREKGDIARAKESLEDLREKVVELEEEFEEALATVEETIRPETLELKEIELRPRKSDISVGRVALVWTPWRVSGDGIAEPAYELDT